MIPQFSSDMWTAAAAAFGDHVWQSTIFAGAAGLVTLVLRKNQARVRYWLWLAASAKFLIPFSWFVEMGKHLTWSTAGTKSQSYVVVSEAMRTLATPTAPVSSGVVLLTAPHSWMQFVGTIVAALWLCGFLVVVFGWWMRWRKIAAAARTAKPLDEGREVEALRRMEQAGGIQRNVEILVSSALLEPGIFGIAHPVLMWPAGISEHLDDAHLEAVIAHEVWHVRRRDNLAAAAHMLVEAAFWFHPLVWWLGTRLVDERERACDEEVLALGSKREVYAESILKTCEFCAGFQLACVSGVTGADLKKRIAHIMTQGAGRRLDLGKKLLLGAAGLVAVAAPIVFGATNVMRSRAEAQAAISGGMLEIRALPSEQDASPATPFISKIASRKKKTCNKSASLAKRVSAASGSN